MKRWPGPGDPAGDGRAARRRAARRRLRHRGLGTNILAPETPPPELTRLTPGGAVDLQVEIPVTIVYVGSTRRAAPGHDPGAVGATAGVDGRWCSSARRGLPATLGLTYTHYESVSAARVRGRLFASAASTARPPGPATE